MGVFVWFFIPDTKGMYMSCPDPPHPLTLAGLSLEKMDELFGVTQLIDQKNADPERGVVESDSKQEEIRVERV
jgi:hypothetical protein